MSTPFQAIAGLGLACVPWIVLLRAPSSSSFNLLQAGTTGFGVVFFTYLVWLALVSKTIREQWPAALIALQVIALASFIECSFAAIYFSMSAKWPHSFDPSSLTATDAAYFAISTATTTGMGDIHPISGPARLVVTAQMVASLYLVVIAITTAVQRVISQREETVS
jgi:hypothetical protein